MNKGIGLHINNEENDDYKNNAWVPSFDQFNLLTLSSSSILKNKDESLIQELGQLFPSFYSHSLDTVV